MAKQLCGDPEIADVDEHKEIGRVLGIFFAEVVAEDPLITFAREANDIEILRVKIDPPGSESGHRIDRALLGEHEPRENRLPLEIITTRLALSASAPYALARVVQKIKIVNPTHRARLRNGRFTRWRDLGIMTR